VLDTSESLGDAFPDFFPPELQDILPAAQKSLVLLQAAHPDHPLLQRNAAQAVIRWFWTAAEVEAAWNGALPPETVAVSSTSEVSFDVDNNATKYKPELSSFRLFDLEPGINFVSAPHKRNDSSPYSQPLQTFIDKFPEAFPAITPTLTHLTSLVLSRLMSHVSTLSSALLRLFLSMTGTFNFQAHLLLLKSYLLVTAPPFRSRLAAALFSDSDSCEGDAKAHSLAVKSLHRGPSRIKKSSDRTQAQAWAVGLAPALLERETWPPVGADLSFFLRTVIVDSFEGENVDTIAGEGETNSLGSGIGRGRHKVIEEAEYRLGFAIRDLPAGTGREKWLNPLCVYSFFLVC
jgi:Gamma tubulin complex component C-terminal